MDTRTHTHAKLAHKRTHTQPLSQLHSTTLRHSDTTIGFWGHCLKARGVGRSVEREQRRRRGGKERQGEHNHEMEKPSTELFALFCKASSSRRSSASIKKGVRHATGRRTDTLRTSRRRGSICSGAGLDILLFWGGRVEG